MRGDFTPRPPRPRPPSRCQVRRYLPEKQRYTLELLELQGGRGHRLMDGLVGRLACAAAAQEFQAPCRGRPSISLAEAIALHRISPGLLAWTLRVM